MENNMSWRGYFYGIAKGHRLLPMVISLLALFLLSGCNDILIREAIIEMKTPPAPIQQNSGMKYPDHASDAI